MNIFRRLARVVMVAGALFLIAGSSNLAWSGPPPQAQDKLPDILRFMDNGNETVTDNQSGLMWEVKLANDDPKCTTVSPDIRCVDARYNWSDLTDGDRTNPDGTIFTVFLAGLNQDIALDRDDINAGCFANYCDWRLPKMSELISIYDPPTVICDGDNPCVDPAFGPTHTLPYWSATSWTATEWCNGSPITPEEYAFVLNYVSGFEQPFSVCEHLAGKDNGTLVVRAVRDAR